MLVTDVNYTEFKNFRMTRDWGPNMSPHGANGLPGQKLAKLCHVVDA